MPKVIEVLEITPRIQVGVLPDLQLQVRHLSMVENARSYHRYVLTPGQDVGGEHALIQVWCAANWTDEVVSDYKAAIPER